MSSDMGDMWRAHQQAGQQRRANNRITSPRILATYGVSFTSHNGGGHLIIRHGDAVVDFWPGTGKYVPRTLGTIEPGGTLTKADSKAGRGVRNLLRMLDKVQSIAEPEADDGPQT